MAWSASLRLVDAGSLIKELLQKPKQPLGPLGYSLPQTQRFAHRQPLQGMDDTERSKVKSAGRRPVQHGALKMSVSAQTGKVSF
jgi:hypothetical protein